MDWNRSTHCNGGMSVIQLTDDELRILRDHRNGAPHKFMRLEFEALIVLSTGAGKKLAAGFAGVIHRDDQEMGRAVERVRAGVNPHRIGWERQRLETRSGAGGGDEGALCRPPSEQGVPADFWDVPRLVDWMREHFNVEYGSRSSCHRRFRIADLSFHRPVGVDQHRAPEAEI